MFVIINPNNVCKKEENSLWVRKWERRQRTKSCSGYSWRCQFFHNVNQARHLEAMYRSDEEYKAYFSSYNISPNVLDHSNLPESWWDEKSRRTEGNWKSQYKVNHQYNIHSNVKDSMSIRICEYEEEYSLDDVDFMLEEDFMEWNKLVFDEKDVMKLEL